MTDVSLVRDTINIISKETRGWLLPSEYKKSVKMNHLIPQKISVIDMILELCEILGITFSVFEPIKLASKKKSWKFMIF